MQKELNNGKIGEEIISVCKEYERHGDFPAIGAMIGKIAYYLDAQAQEIKDLKKKVNKLYAKSHCPKTRVT